MLLNHAVLVVVKARALDALPPTFAEVSVDASVPPGGSVPGSTQAFGLRV